MALVCTNLKYSTKGVSIYRQSGVYGDVSQQQMAKENWQQPVIDEVDDSGLIYAVLCIGARTQPESFSDAIPENLEEKLFEIVKGLTISSANPSFAGFFSEFETLYAYASPKDAMKYLLSCLAVLEEDQSLVRVVLEAVVAAEALYLLEQYVKVVLRTHVTQFDRDTVNALMELEVILASNAYTKCDTSRVFFKGNTSEGEVVMTDSTQRYSSDYCANGRYSEILELHDNFQASQPGKEQPAVGSEVMTFIEEISYLCPHYVSPSGRYQSLYQIYRDDTKRKPYQKAVSKLKAVAALIIKNQLIFKLYRLNCEQAIKSEVTKPAQRYGSDMSQVSQQDPELLDRIQKIESSLKVQADKLQDELQVMKSVRSAFWLVVKLMFADEDAFAEYVSKKNEDERKEFEKTVYRTMANLQKRQSS